jgi:hypothetical protein
VPILQSWFSLLIFKLMFKGVSQCMLIVGMLYFGLFNPFNFCIVFDAQEDLITARLDNK